MNKPSWKPTCPNHGATLEGMPFPLPAKGTGMCPVSGAYFEFEAEVQDSETSMVVDKNGNKVKKVDWKLSGNEK